jgi:SMODS and SLOG-associating 2TM effector domain 3/SMODS and SLOG-associating 2TM effector domain 1
MTVAEYPALFSASDKAALAAQRTYLRLVGWQLALWVVPPVTAILAIGGSSSTVSGWWSFAAALSPSSITISLALTLILRVQRYEKVWFDCRAVAASVKTVTWRYMMQAPPYNADKNDIDVDAEFLNELTEIRKARPGVAAHIVGQTSSTTEISDSMRKIRALPLDERKTIYISARLLDQKTWYENRARANRSSASRWFWGIVIIQMIALSLASAVAILQFTHGPSSINLLVSLFTTLAATFVAWTQTKRHEELKQSYALAAQELSDLEALEPHVSDPKSFQAFVTQVEEAISREHTMWRARRNISLEARRWA